MQPKDDGRSWSTTDQRWAFKVRSPNPRVEDYGNVANPGVVGSIAVDTVFEGKRKISPTTRTRTVLIPEIMMLEREAALKPAR